MSAEQLSAVAGVILSLAFSYIPGLQDVFEPLTPTEKRLVMASLIIIVAIAAFLAGCRGLLSITCDQPGVIGLLTALVAALVANQATFLISPKATKF